MDNELDIFIIEAVGFHAATTWLKRSPDPIGQLAHWLVRMEKYNFNIEHRRGVRHGNAVHLVVNNPRRPLPQISRSHPVKKTHRTDKSTGITPNRQSIGREMRIMPIEARAHAYVRASQPKSARMHPCFLANRCTGVRERPCVLANGRPRAFVRPNTWSHERTHVSVPMDARARPSQWMHECVQANGCTCARIHPCVRANGQACVRASKPMDARVRTSQ